jgi:DNA-binding MarR family transcriptional regulator
MANIRYTYQQATTVSIPRDELLDSVVYNDVLSKTDLRVCLFLLTELNGWSPPKTGEYNDPCNYKKIDVKQIAEKLDISKKDVKRAINNLDKLCVIEKGDSNSVRDGYRFMF